MYIRDAIQAPGERRRSVRLPPGDRSAGVRPAGIPRLLPVLVGLFFLFQAWSMTQLFRMPRLCPVPVENEAPE